MLGNIEVLLSTYNGERYLEQQLNSILKQSYNDIVIRIRDDGSTDNTKLILRKYQDNHENIIVDEGENVGVIESFFMLLKSGGASSRYFAFCDQDDLWAPDKISRAIEVMDREGKEKPIAYFSRMEYVDENLRSLGLSPKPKILNFSNALVENVISGCVLVMNQGLRNLLVGNLPKKRVLMHDWWVYLVVTAFGKVIYDEKPSIKYRQHEFNVVGGTNSLYQQMRKRIKRFFKNGNAYSCSDQARELNDRYQGLMGEDNTEILTSFISSKSNGYKRFLYSLNKNVKRQTLVDDMILRVLILLGRY